MKPAASLSEAVEMVREVLLLLAGNNLDGARRTMRSLLAASGDGPGEVAVLVRDAQLALTAAASAADPAVSRTVWALVHHLQTVGAPGISRTGPAANEPLV